jgi:hypothetical protein
MTTKIDNPHQSRARMGRGKSWTSDMDRNLCVAWTYSSEDPIAGTYQKKSAFWTTVQSHFMRLSGSVEERTISSLQCRWADINKKCTKFNGIMTQTRNVTRSGYTEDNYVEDALKVFKHEMGEEFNFLSCWQYLKEKPKWTINSGSIAAVVKKEQVIKKEKGESKPTLMNKNEVLYLDDDEDVDEVGNTRPPGAKDAKNNRATAQRQIEIDDKAARAMEARAETHKVSLHFKIMAAVSNTDAAKEWLAMMSQNILEEAKKEVEDKKRAAEAQKMRAAKKKEKLNSAVTPRSIVSELSSSSEDKENSPPAIEIVEVSPFEETPSSFNEDLSPPLGQPSPPEIGCCAKGACFFARQGMDIDIEDESALCLKCGGRSHAVCCKVVSKDIFICGTCMGWEKEETTDAEAAKLLEV